MLTWKSTFVYLPNDCHTLPVTMQYKCWLIFLLLFDIMLYFIFRMHELGILPKQKKVFFGQLFGMSDPISFTLGELNSVSEP